MRIGRIRCLFCENVISFEDGQLISFISHLEEEHEVIFRKELFLALSFLSEKEIEVLAVKMKPRMEYFLEHGELFVNDNDLFEEGVDNNESSDKNEEAAQHSDDNDSNDDESEFQQQQIQQILNDETDSDSENESLNINYWDDQTNTNQNNKCVKSEGVKVNDHHGSNGGKLIKKEYISLEEVTSQSMLKCDSMSMKACKVMVKNVNCVITQNNDQEQENLFDDDLDPEQEIILQNVSCKMDIGDTEVDNPEENWVSSSDLNLINLVEKFSSLNQCRLCFSSFSSKGNVRVHEETVHKDDQEALHLSFFGLKDLVFPCNMCPQVPGFLTENILNTHKRLQHRVQVKNTTVKCDVCQKVVKYHSYKSHMEIHTDEKKYECNLCYTKFRKVRYLQEHQKKIHSNEIEYINKQFTESDLQFNCEVCSLKFVTENILTYHKKSHEKRVVYNCQFCASSFEHPKLFKNHCVKVHGKRAPIDGSDKKFKCKLCYSGFSKQSYLKNHTKIHKEDQEAFDRNLMDEDLKFKCRECDQRFISSNILNYHTNKNHKEYEFEELRESTFDGDVKTFKCKLCYTTFKHFSSMHAHILQVHQKEKFFLKSTIVYQDLKHGCSECDQRFVSKDIVKYHMNRIHKDMEFEDLRVPAYNEEDKKFKCKLCYTNFTKFSVLHLHITQNHQEEKMLLKSTISTEDLNHKCGECELNFVTESVLEYHKSRAHVKKEKFVRCKICSKVVKKYSFPGHKLTHTLERNHECQLCYVKFKHMRGKLDHQKKCHKSETEIEFLLNGSSQDQFEYECDNCGLKFLMEETLISHQKKHVMEKFKNFNCQYCPKIFFKFKVYTNHVVEVHRKRLPVEQSEKKYGCKLCYRGFKFNKSLHDHINKIHKEDLAKLDNPISNDDLKFKCDSCDLKFISASILEYHTQFGHKKQEKSNKCKLCYTVFTKNSYLLNHQKTVHKNETEFLEFEIDPSDLKFECEKCDNKFLSANILDYHINYGHKKMEQECKLCYLKFKKRSYLLNHEKSVHRNETELLNRQLKESDRKFSCNLCEKKFVTEIHVKLHSKSHQDMGQECNLCYLKFKKRTYLMNHEKSVHRNETELLNKELKESDRKFSCNLCEKKFVTEFHVKLHSKSHQSKKFEIVRKDSYDESENRYSCKLCYTKFKKFAGLTSHIQSVHRDDLELFQREIAVDELVHSCPNCGLKFVSGILLESHWKKHQSEKFEFLRKESFNVLDNSYKCKLCYTVYRYFRDLTTHIQSIHREDMELVQRQISASELVQPCSECDDKFVSEPLLDYHNSKVHNLDKTTKHCKLCDINFKSYSGFMQHKYKIHKLELAAFKTKFEDKDRLFKCRTCEKKCFTQISLDHHISRHHTHGKKKLKIKAESYERYCQLCYLMYKEPQYLRRHKQNVHAGELDAFEKDLTAEDMTHECTKCDKTFYSKNTLDHHMHRKHKQTSGTYDFPCKLCYLPFSYKSEMLKHLKAVHREDVHLLDVNIESMLTHQCNFCDKLFASEHILSYHYRYQHKEEKRQDLNCEYCNKVFKWSNGRKRVMENHMRILHNIDGYKVSEHKPAQKENDTVQNFMLLLNSLK